MMARGIVLLCLSVVVAANADPLVVGMKLLGRMYDNCERSQELVKCFKLQAAKLADRASRMERLPIFDGVTLVKRREEARSSPIPQAELKSLSSSQVDRLLEMTASNLLNSHRIDIAPLNAGADMGRSLNEARSKLKKMIGPIIAGVAIKGGFLAIAFQTIAIIAGKALLIGKIALLLSAIIGLKKLVSGGEAHEKTTYEIVKHPQVSQSHTYSSSHYGNDFDTTGPGGHYRRSVEDEAAAQDRAYRAYAQKQ